MNKRFRQLCILAASLFSATIATANSDIVAGGNAFTVILGKDGKVYTAGLNTNFQLGRQLSSGTKSSVLAPVENLQNITSISAGWTHALALDCKGRVWAWGSGHNGELGNGINSLQYAPPVNGSSGADQRVPVQVCAGVTNMAYPMAPLENITAITASLGRSYAITQDQKLIAWGKNTAERPSSSFLGCLGTNGTGWDTNGSPTLSPQPKAETSLPVYVINTETGLALEKVIAVDSKFSFGYALVDDDNDGDPTTGRVYAWGEGWSGDTPVIAGTINQTSATSAVLVVTKDLKPLTGISKITAGAVAGFFVHKVTGNVYSVGNDHLGQRGLGMLAYDRIFAELVVSGDTDNNKPRSALKNVVDVAVGDVQILVATRIGKTNYLLSWGGVENYGVDGTITTGHLGQNNLGGAEYLDLPRFVKYRNGDTVKNVLSVSASSGGSYVTILDPVTLDQKLLYFGDNSVGQAAMGTPISDNYTPIFPYPTELPFFEGFAEARPVADLGSRILTLCPNEIPNTGKQLFAGCNGSDYSYTWDITIPNKTLSQSEIKAQYANATGANMKIFAAGKYKVSIQQKVNTYFDKTYCPVTLPVSDSVEVQFCHPDITLATNSITKELSSIEFTGTNDEVYGLFQKQVGGDTLSIDTVSGGQGYFDFPASKLQKVTADLNGTAYPANEHYIRAYSENISVHNLEILPAPTFTGYDNFDRNNANVLQNIKIYTDSALLKSVKVKITNYYSSPTIQSFIPVICDEKISPYSGEYVGDPAKILYTAAVCTVSANGEITVPINVMLKRNSSEPQSYWLGFIAAGQSFLSGEMIQFPGVPQTDSQYPSVKFEACSKYSDLIRPIATERYGFAYDFQLATYGSNPCGRTPIDFKLERAPAAATPTYNNGTPKTFCVKDTVSSKPNSLGVDGGAVLCHNIYYFRGIRDLDSLKLKGISNAYQQFLNIQNIDSLPRMRAPYDSAGYFTMVIVDALYPDSTNAWAYQNLLFSLHPRTSLGISPVSSAEFCPANTDSVSVKLNGVAPFALSYSYSGKTNTLTTSDNILKFAIGTEPGDYDFKLLSMSDANCPAFAVEDIAAKTAGGIDTVLRDTIQRSYTVRNYPAMTIAAPAELVAGTTAPVNLADYYAPVSTAGTSTYTIVDGDLLTDGLWDISDREMPAGDYCIAFEYSAAGECAYSDTFCLKLIPALRYDLTIVVTDGTDPLANISLTVDGTEYTTDATGKVIFADVLPDTFIYSISQDGYLPVSGSYLVEDADIEESISLVKIVYSAELTVTDGVNPIAGAVVSFDGTDYVSDAKGTVAIQTISYGSYPITVEAQGFKSLSAVLNAKGTVAELLLPLKMREQRVEIFNPIAESACGSMDFAGQKLTVSGEYRDTIVTTANKDSIIILTATIWPVYEISKDVELAFGSTYLLGDKEFTASGTFDSTFVTVNGCDSTVTINLTILPQTGYVIDSIATACGQYEFAGTVYEKSGIYRDSLTTDSGVDSVIVLDLTINPVYNETAEKTVAYGESFVFGTQTLTQTGKFTEVFQSANGCDSTVTLTFTVEKLAAVVNNIVESACGKYIYKGVEYNLAGVYTLKDTIVGGAANGADSIVVLDLTVNNVFDETAEKSIVYGESFVFGTQTLTKTGVYTEVFQSVTACDSSVTLTFTVEKPAAVETEITETACGSYLFGGILRDTSGIYRDTLVGEFADTITVLNLTFGQTYSEEIQVTLWVGNSYMFGDEEIVATTVGISAITKTFTSVYGCDSVVKMNLTTVDDNPGDFVTIRDTACGSYTFGNLQLTESGTYHGEYISQIGKDSTVKLYLVVNPIYSETQTVSVNYGETYRFGEMNLTESGTYTQVFSSVTGCDSTVVLTFNVEAEQTVNPGDTLSVEIPENPVVGDVIISLPDTAANGDTLIYTVSDTTIFEIIDNKLVVKDSSAFNAEKNGELTVVVYIKNGDKIDSALVKIPVINVNEMPELVLDTLSISENSDSLSVIATLPLLDQDGDKLIYSLVDSSVVTLVNGALVIADSSAFDAEGGSVAIQLIISDGVFTDTVVVNIAVKNENDNSPVFASTSISSELTSLQLNGATFTLVAANDADGDKLTYRIIDVVANAATTKALKSNEGIFAIDAATGIISVSDISLIDFVATESYLLTIEVSDGLFTDTLTHTITLKNLSTDQKSVTAPELDIYPTVANSTIHIATPLTGTLSISSLAGIAVVYTADFDHAADVDVSALPAGAYLVKIVSANEVVEGSFFRQ